MLNGKQTEPVSKQVLLAI